MLSLSDLPIIFLGIASLAPRAAEAFWRLPCSSPVVMERADPIADPGMVSTHMHTVMGSNAFNFSMDYALTQTATCSTCKVTKDLSSYWVPNLYYHAQNGSFIPVKQSGGALIYYLQRTDEKDPEFKNGLIAFPKDFRMIAGDPTNRNKSDSLEQRAVSFACLGYDGPATPELPKRNCPAGLRTQLIFPSCWDGKNLDSPDHRSHMAYPSGVDTGFCPPTHPKRFITLFYEVTWNVDELKDQWYGDKQPFVFSHGDPDGYGYHGDFLNGWDIPTLQKAINECTDASGVVEKCGAFEFRADTDMAACQKLPRVHEPVKSAPAPAGSNQRLSGGGNSNSNSNPDAVLAALPGCNPIQAGPEPAVKQAAGSCAEDTATIGDPLLPFTDVSQTAGWKYAGCFKDGGGLGGGRTVSGGGGTDANSGLMKDEPDMTVDKCVKFCGEAAQGGMTYAGVEYKTQCFCGKTLLTEGRAPANGTIGECNMPCGGDGKQICGGYGQVSVYQKCSSGSDCQNIKFSS
ncbi:WSC domain-containing protein [Apiospora marii]|uniref:WSC domain-containing protein n=1 Tax=Apiospora marii TaxID=335849 RepID=A0ABR1R566_9PEZI